jgi:catechol 2,3-dioxygenase-like lactoylglutathione lyase family enzyme
MSSQVQLDHVVVAVRDLREAGRLYRALGFNVVDGGHHGHAPTRNALIAFEDGSFIELIEWTAHSRHDRWQRILESDGEGPVDFALSTSHLPAMLERARDHGIEMFGPVDGSRVTPLGHRLRWRVGRPASSELPFLCSDITPRTLRIPGGDALQHANGASGIDTVFVAVTDAQGLLDKYRSLFVSDLDSMSVRDSRFAVGRPGVNVAATRMNGCTVALVSPEPSSTAPAAEFIRSVVRRRGPGVYALALIVPNGSKARISHPLQTCGMYLRFSAISESLACMIFPAE